MPRTKSKTRKRSVAKRGRKSTAVGQVVSTVKRKVPKKLLHPVRNLRSKDSAETTLLIAKGSAAIAAAASAIAAGAFLADERRREKVVKGAMEVYKRTKKLRSKLPEELPDAYYAVSHQVGRKIGSKNTKTAKRKTSRK